MKQCICGRAIVRRTRKGGREREYCCDACRQRACRQRNARKREYDRLKREEDERVYEELKEELSCIRYPPRAWLVDLWQKDRQIEHLQKSGVE